MSFLNLGSIRKNLVLLVVLTVLPAMAILFYSGMEQRRQAIEDAQQEVLLTAHTMAELQKDVTLSAHQILSTLALIPEIQMLDVPVSREIFRSLLKRNPNYRNITLLDLGGDVLASAVPFEGANLADRKHVRDALATKDFAPGEYIMTRVGSMSPAFPFAYPVLDAVGKPVAILTVAVNLTVFSELYYYAERPENSYVAVTDHRGVRLFYYPEKTTTNPIGTPIKTNAWEVARQTQGPGIITSPGSDGTNRISAFDPVYFNDNTDPYMYVWAGVPEAHILAPANTILMRNLLLMLMATIGALFIAWSLGRKTLINPINKLMTLTNEFARGMLDNRIDQSDRIDEFAKLTDSFHEMAASLSISQEDLRNSENKFRLFSDYTHDWEYWSDPEGAYVYMSPSCMRITGYTPEEFMDDPELLIQITTPEFREELQQHLEQGKNHEFPECQMTFSITTRTGELCWLEHNCLSIYDGRGKYVGRRGCNRDITQRKQFEAEQSALEAQLRQKFKMEAVGTMAGGIAHNFNNNLSIILGNVELSQMKGHDPEINELLSNAKIAILRARDLVSQIMTYSRKGMQARAPLQLHLIIDETLKLLSATIPSTIQLNQTISPDSQRVTINADASQIQEILLNLYGNAVHAMDEKGELNIMLDVVELRDKGLPDLEQHKPGHYAKISIQDSGCGMSAEIQERIFDPFFTTKEMYEGTGMGLATVQGIVNQHDGLIKVYSTLGEGATFELYFPIIEDSQQIMASVPIDEDLPKGTEKILFVDDDEMLVKLGELMLTEVGYQVTVMTDSTEALKLFANKTDQFDLVITDQTMPRLTGKELIQKLKQIRPEIQTIICTGYSSKVDAATARKFGADAFLMKPLILPVLLQTVRRVLDGEKNLSR